MHKKKYFHLEAYNSVRNIFRTRKDLAIICAYFSLCLFLHCKMLQAHWYAQLQSQSRQYSRGPGFSYWRPVSETKVWVLGPVFYVRHIPHPTNPDGHWMCSCLFDTLSSLTPKSTGAYQQHFLLECSSPPSSG